jgi:hypothetical protein
LNDPFPETWSHSRAIWAARGAYERLKREEHSAVEARGLVAEVINAEELAMFKKQRSFDEPGLVERLRQLRT